MWNLTRLACKVGRGSLPQIDLHLIKIDNVPFGISMIGAHNTDIKLLQLASLL